MKYEHKFAKFQAEIIFCNNQRFVFNIFVLINIYQKLRSSYSNNLEHSLYNLILCNIYDVFKQAFVNSFCTILCHKIF